MLNWKGLMIILRWKIMVILLTFVTAFALTGCADQEENNEEAVAVVNGTEIPRSEFDNAFEQQQMFIEQQGMDLEAEENQEMREQIEQGIVDQLIGQELVTQELEEREYEVSQEEIDTKRAEMAEIYTGGDEDQLLEMLEQQGIGEEELIDSLSLQIEAEKLIMERYGEIEVSEEEVNEAFEMQKEQALAQAEESGEEVNEEELAEEMKPMLREQLEEQKLLEQQTKLMEELRQENEENIEVLI